jgi:acyl-CoA hydrolase
VLPRIVNTPQEAVACIDNDEVVWVHSMGATPRILLEGLAQHALSRQNLTLLQLHTEGSEMLSDPEMRGHIRCRCFFVGASTRKAVQDGRADYVPILLSEIPKLIRSEEQRVDAALVQVSPPDGHGNCSLGISVEATSAAIEHADKVIAHINPCMPRTHGDSSVPYSRFHTVYEQAVPLSSHESPIQTAVTQAIGRNVAGLVGDGDCLQTGIGAIPDAVLACLDNHRDLGIHTEMFSDGVLPLVESGVITGARKRNHPGSIVTTFVLGSQRLYDFVDDNPTVRFLDVEYVNDVRTIRRNPHAFSINSALQIDVSGQICADSIGTSIYSGVGGQIDFVRGASLSQGGRAVIALPSTAAGGRVSRIVPILSEGAGVVTTRANAHYVATEYGIVNLRGRSLRERARGLIDIAHPHFREQINQQVFELWGLNLN